MVVTRTLKSLFWIVTLGLILVCLMASPAWADEPVGAPPLRDAPLDGPTAGEAVNGAPIPADDENFIADSGGDLDLYLFRPDRRPDGKLKFNIGIGRYYFNSEDAKEVEFDSNGFLTEDWASASSRPSTRVATWSASTAAPSMSHWRRWVRTAA